MIPEAVVRGFLAKTLKKFPVSDRNSPGSVRHSTQESGDPYPAVGFDRFLSVPSETG
jgi:hypothetical protein